MCRARAFLNLMSQGLVSVNLPEVCEFPICLSACFTITSFSNLLQAVCTQTNPFEKTSEQGCTQSCSDECGNPAPPLLFLPASASVPCWDWWLLFASCLCLRATSGTDVYSFTTRFCILWSDGQYAAKAVQTKLGFNFIFTWHKARGSFLLLEMLFSPLFSVSQTQPEKQVNKLNGMFHLPLSNTLKT